MTCACGFCADNPPKACEQMADVIAEVDGAWKPLCLYCSASHEHITRVIFRDDLHELVEKALVHGHCIDEESWQNLVVPHIKGFRAVSA